MAERFSNLDLLKMSSPAGDANHPVVVPKVGLGYATAVLTELLRLKGVEVYPSSAGVEVVGAQSSVVG
jgi:hypothetical protein